MLVTTRSASELHAEAALSGRPCDCPACAPELWRDDSPTITQDESRWAPFNPELFAAGFAHFAAKAVAKAEGGEA